MNTGVVTCWKTLWLTVAVTFLPTPSLIAAIHAEPTARALLESEAPPREVLGELSARDDDVGRAAKKYLDTVGHRLLDGLDVGDPCVLEVPQVMVERLRVALAGGGSAGGPSQEEIARVRDRVPTDRRDAFDDLLAEARLTYRIRDERGIFSDVWAGGITRTVILAAGDRLAAQVRIDKPTDLIEADYAEMRALIGGLDGPSALELAERAHHRATHRASEAPWRSDLHPNRRHHWTVYRPQRPARCARSTRRSARCFAPSDAQSEPTVVRGAGASPGVYVGTARLIASPTEFGRLRPGDVLVTQSTSESFNMVLPLVGATVTDSGGLLSHAAIVSREYGIPGVVGSRVDPAPVLRGSRGALVRDRRGLQRSQFRRPARHPAQRTARWSCRGCAGRLALGHVRRGSRIPPPARDRRTTATAMSR